jgi:hypothetical protein
LQNGIGYTEMEAYIVNGSIFPQRNARVACIAISPIEGDSCVRKPF